MSDRSIIIIKDESDTASKSDGIEVFENGGVILIPDSGQTITLPPGKYYIGGKYERIE